MNPRLTSRNLRTRARSGRSRSPRSRRVHRDPGGPIGELESALLDSLAETTLAARRLELLCRTNQMLALMVLNAHGKEGGDRLVALMAAENALRHGRKGKAKKGADGPQ